ncbi:hypothetical protein F4553_003480 [Allocatelliglobosispora scoriae]|uniref:Uncharacterized protein n=1 Tax=Allocatelliglobosispora scoriae TaxID=643052 RepID=A0A841BTI8_9ACTN|nr:hypothetical protein [Allocatelliglobosispora scoriae]
MRVIGVAGRDGRRILLLGRGGEPAGYLAAQGQREPHPRVDEPAEQPDGGEPGDTGEGRPVRVAAPGPQLATVQLAPGIAERERGVRVGEGELRQGLGAELPVVGEEGGVALAGRGGPQGGPAQVVVDGHREEHLTRGEVQHRLEAAYELQRRKGSRHRNHRLPSSLPA